MAAYQPLPTVIKASLPLLRGSHDKISTRTSTDKPAWQQHAVSRQASLCNTLWADLCQLKCPVRHVEKQRPACS